MDLFEKLKPLNDKNVRRWLIKAFEKSVGEKLTERTLFRMTMRLATYIFKNTGIECQVEITFKPKYMMMVWEIKNVNVPISLRYHITFQREYQISDKVALSE